MKGNVIMTQKTFDGQTATFLARIITSFPTDFTGEEMQKCIDDPAGLKRVMLSWLRPGPKEAGKSLFDPATFIGKDWSYVQPRDPRSARLGLLADYSKVKLSIDWLQGELILDGETRRERILADATHTALNADHFLDLWTNKGKIPESWKKVKGIITFDGDVLQYSDGDHAVIYLCWRSGKWAWGCGWLGREWSADDPSVVLAS